MTVSSHFSAFLRSLRALLMATFCCVVGASGQSRSSRPLITTPIDEHALITLRGNTHPLARPAFDLGTASSDLPVDRMLLVLKRSPEQQTALKELLDDQQDKASPSFHKWLNPTDFGHRFGPADIDIQAVTSWLKSHGFMIGTVTNGRTMIEFSGSAGQVREAFHTSIHKYLVHGEQHWANASDPQIPTALAPAIAGIYTLHNFLKSPQVHYSKEAAPAQFIPGKKPQVTFTQDGKTIHALAPQDYAVIYNIKPLYDNFNEGGGVIGVVGRSNLFNGGQDIDNFRNVFGGGFFNIVVNGPDPGDLGGGEEVEATLDSSWASAIAPNAQVRLFVSASTNTTDGVDLSELYIVDGNQADIMTESFGSCELYATDTQLAGTRALAEQAAAQGITYIVSTGDNGSEACDDPNLPPASNPISVNQLASTAFNIAVGGTMFSENGQDGNYWTNTPPISETAISYIPEGVWNESSITNGLWAGSGGASAGNIAAGGTTPGVPKPSWQFGVTGIPDDGVRDVPDISLTAAAHDPYLLCLEGSCVPDSQGQIFVYFISGTSAAAPSFAGIMSLVASEASRTTQFRQGAAGYILYRLAATQAAYPLQCNGSNGPSLPDSTCIFNDVTVGNNVVPGEPGDSYAATPGFDLASGLGSLNVTNLVNQWTSVSFRGTRTTLSLGATTVTHGSPLPFTITVHPSNGSGVPTGNVLLEAFVENAFPTGTFFFGPFPLSSGTISSTATNLPGGNYPIAAHYAGDNTFAPSDAAAGLVNLTVTAEPSTTAISILTADQTGNAIPFVSGPFGSFVYLRADVAGFSGHGIATGSVTFTDTFGSIPGGSNFTLNSQGNTATPNGVSAFDSGQHSITAAYSGDLSFNPSNTPSASIFTITPGFFASFPSGQSFLVISAPGLSGQSGMTVSNSTGFSGTITLACQGLPKEATCTFTPSSINANGTLTATNVGLTVSTKAATAQVRTSQRHYFLATWLSGCGLLFSIVLLDGRGARIRGLLLLVLLALVVVAPGCGGGNGGGSGTSVPPPDSGTPVGNYAITITATSGSNVTTTGFVLVVQ